MNKTLYVILPYFNFLKKKGFDKNLDIFLKNFKHYPNVEIIISEASFSDEFLEVNCFKHLKYKTSQCLWYKENLINLAIKSLPEDWNYVAWIDRDIEFLKETWVDETIESLNNFDIIQPWSHILYLNENKNIQSLYKNVKDCISACYFILEKSNSSIHTSHPGHAWAANKTFFNRIKFLYDKTIFGGGDLVLIDCILNSLDENNQFSPIFNKIPINYASSYKNIKFSFIFGSIYHHFHGEVYKRRIININDKEMIRDEIYNFINLTNEMFFYREDGLLQLKKDFLYVEDYFKKYLLQRDEI